jgi:hypothetical protein
MERALLILGFCGLCAWFHHLSKNPNVWNAKTAKRIANGIGFAVVCVGLVFFIRAIVSSVGLHKEVASRENYIRRVKYEKQAFQAHYGGH